MASDASGDQPQVRLRVALPEWVTTGAGAKRRRPRELRILGDEERGFILSGAADLLDERQGEFWFPALAEAVAAAKQLGVDAADWEEIVGP